MFNLFSGKYVVDFDPYAIRFPQDWFIDGVRWYGLAYFAGFIIGLLLLTLYTKKKRSRLTYDDNSSLITYLLFGIIIGGRLGYMFFYDYVAFFQNPLIAFQIWKGGMASHGGFIGVILSIYIFAKRRNLKFFEVGDLVVTIACPGIFLGRLANFVNGELWGKVSESKFAMIFPESAPHLPIDQILARHPSQLYEAFFEGLILFLYLQFRFWKHKPKAGMLSGEFLVLYGIFRIFCEIFREPDVGISLLLGLSRGTFYSIFTIIVGIFFIILALRKTNTLEK